MPEPKWIIEDGVFENQDSIVKALENNRIKYDIYSKSKILEITNTKSKTNWNLFFYGSTYTLPIVQKYTTWTHFCTLENYQCHKYYPILRDYLLNKDYYLLPYDELKHLKSARAFGNKIFIRPDKGFKTFTGQIINLEEDWQSQTEKDYSACDGVRDELLLISSPKEIKAEYRFIVGGKTIITGCQYKPEIKPIDKPLAILTFVQNLLGKYEPDPMYTIDVAETNNGYKVIELNSFSCAGWYNCDPNLVVVEAQKTIKNYIEDQYECSHI